VTSFLDKVRRLAPASTTAPAKPALAARFAAPNVKPEAWQLPRAPIHASLGRMRPEVEYSEELDRVLAIPRRPVRNLESPEALAFACEVTARFSRRNDRCTCVRDGKRCLKDLRPAQAWALDEMSKVGGLLGPIGVGHGKTMLDILTPLAVPNVRLAVLLVPPGLVGQLAAEYVRISEHFRVPSLVLPGGGGTIRPGQPILHVVPYSRFSRPESTALLEQIAPDLIIADEAHKLRDKGTATTSRVLRYFAAHPNTRLCAWSGTLTAKSIRDYAHLAAIALGEGSPLPLDPQVVESWSLALDPIEWRAGMGALEALCQPGEDVRDGYRRRLHETVGVTGTKAAAVDASIILAERKPPPMPRLLVQMLDHLRSAWERPDGEELVDILQVAKSARELACGFFYKWTFPRNESPQLIAEWFRLRQAWHKELREKLRHRTEHMDSPLLCAKAAIRAWEGYDGPLPVWHAEAWRPWVGIRDKVQPVSVAEWVDDYLARDAAEWARKNRGVVWYLHDAFGRRVAELAGLPLHEGGPDAEKRILAETGSRSVVASIKAHGTGRDGLQRLFARQLIANPPASGAEWEQLLGRLHRIGQDKDEVETDVYRHTPEMAEALDKALHQAKYIESTMATLQKLLAADVTWLK